MKKTVLLAVLAMVVAGSVFAQEQGEKTGYIKPTWGIGFSSVTVEYGGQSDTEGLFALSLDVDFVNAFGLTFGLQTLMAWNDDVPAESLANFGLGYTYNANVWSIGGKLMAVPLMNGGIGLDINGTYWFNRNIGITGIMDIYFTASDIDWVAFSMRAGVSAKF